LAILPYKKDNTTKRRIPAKRDPTTEPAEPPKPPLSPSSPQEEKFWVTREPSRTLRFSENLLDEEVNLGDISTASFGSPLATPLPSLRVLGNVDLPNDPTITQFPNFNNNSIKDDREETQHIGSQDPKLSSPDRSGPIVPDMSPTQAHRPNSVLSKSESKEDADLTIEIPTSKKKKIKVNIEVERIIVSEFKIFRNGCTHQFLTLKVQDMVYCWRHFYPSYSNRSDDSTLRQRNYVCTQILFLVPSYRS
jgi:hypothetical protein